MKKFKAGYVIIPLWVIVIILMIVAILAQMGILTNKEEQKWKIEYEQLVVENTIWSAIKWEERIISEQFYNLDYLGVTYSSRNTEVSSDNIECFLENAVLSRSG